MIAKKCDQKGACGKKPLNKMQALMAEKRAAAKAKLALEPKPKPKSKPDRSAAREAYRAAKKDGGDYSRIKSRLLAERRARPELF